MSFEPDPRVEPVDGIDSNPAPGVVTPGVAPFGSPSAADEVGEAAGGISGVLVGAGIGSLAGPVGTVIGGIAGALGGWWAGRAMVEAGERLSESDDEYFRNHFESSSNRLADQGYDNVRGAYYLGYVASHNPNFIDSGFIGASPELERAWVLLGNRGGQWLTVEPYARTAFERGREKRRQAELAGQINPEKPDDKRP